MHTTPLHTVTHRSFGRRMLRPPEKRSQQGTPRFAGRWRRPSGFLNRQLADMTKPSGAGFSPEGFVLSFAPCTEKGAHRSAKLMHKEGVSARAQTQMRAGASLAPFAAARGGAEVSDTGAEPLHGVLSPAHRRFEKRFRELRGIQLAKPRRNW